MENDQIYFSRRAAEERVAAMKAPHLAARTAHLDMAERYDELVRAMAAYQVQMLTDRALAPIGVKALHLDR